MTEYFSWMTCYWILLLSIIKKEETYISYKIYVRIIQTSKHMPTKYQRHLSEISLDKYNWSFHLDLSQNNHEIGRCIEKIHMNTPVTQNCLHKNDWIIEINDQFVDDKKKETLYTKD